MHMYNSVLSLPLIKSLPSQTVGAVETGYWNISDVLPKLKGTQKHIWIWATSSGIFHVRKVPV